MKLYYFSLSEIEKYMIKKLKIHYNSDITEIKALEKCFTFYFSLQVYYLFFHSP